MNYFIFLVLIVFHFNLSFAADLSPEEIEANIFLDKIDLYSGCVEDICGKPELNFSKRSLSERDPFFYKSNQRVNEKYNLALKRVEKSELPEGCVTTSIFDCKENLIKVLLDIKNYPIDESDIIQFKKGVHLIVAEYKKLITLGMPISLKKKLVNLIDKTSIKYPRTSIEEINNLLKCLDNSDGCNLSFLNNLLFEDRAYVHSLHSDTYSFDGTGEIIVSLPSVYSIKDGLGIFAHELAHRVEQIIMKHKLSQKVDGPYYLNVNFKNPYWEYRKIISSYALPNLSLSLWNKVELMQISEDWADFMASIVVSKLKHKLKSQPYGCMLQQSKDLTKQLSGIEGLEKIIKLRQPGLKYLSYISKDDVKGFAEVQSSHSLRPWRVFHAYAVSGRSDSKSCNKVIDELGIKSFIE